MKKKNLKNLKLKKKTVSSLQKDQLRGGDNTTSGNQTWFASCNTYCPTGVCETNVACETFWETCANACIPDF